jgi:hypothetical protein
VRHTQVGADIVLAGSDEGGVPNPPDLVAEVAGGEHGIGGGIGNGVVGKQPAQAPGDAFRMLLPELGREPALLRRSCDGRNAAFLEEGERSTTFVRSSAVRPATALRITSRSMWPGFDSARYGAMRPPNEKPARWALERPR